MSGLKDGSNDIQFVTDTDVDAELEEMRLQVESLQEDLQLKALQDNAAREEGTRKTTISTASVSAGGGAGRGNPSVFVAGFDARTTEADIRVFFVSCGTVVRLTLLKDRHTGQPKGTAYIEFETQEQAQAAILKDGQALHGKPLKVAPKRDNVPAFQRGMGIRGGRGGGRGAAAMTAVAMLASMMGSGMGFSPYGATRARGRGRGRGAH
ncbi:unnamed protein product [Phytomonas sp. Hart1]|nr:unnamed protein product [Phytomonas sp. Hart1]|eukprot:CCW68118.1 unnamed protein product [Phytomonas sp. isolate Hart1]